MGIINNLKEYIDERKKYKLELERKNDYKRTVIRDVSEEVKPKEAVYRKEIHKLTTSDDVKYYIIDDEDLDFLVIVGKNGKYAELFNELPIKPKEELEKLIANKDYKGLIRANYVFDSESGKDVGVYFAPGLIELTTEEANEMLAVIEYDMDMEYDERYFEALEYIFRSQSSEIDEIIDTILEEKYMAEYPESAAILMKKKEENT